MSDSEAEYFELYLEDTDEQIDALAAALRSWQQDPSNESHRTESLRLLSAMEGAAGAMEFENVRALNQHLNQMARKTFTNRDDSLAIITRVMRGAEFLRICNERLRAGEALNGSAELLEQLQAAMG
jgi:chemotaxis protein histidine kinase CheA